MKRIKVILKWLLLVWGGFSLIGTMGIFGYMIYELGPGNKTKIDKATIRDVRFIYTWCGLSDDNQIEKVIHSYESPRSLTGNHLDVYAIKVRNIKVEKLKKGTIATADQWIHGDQLTPVVKNAIELAIGFMNCHKLTWFPKEKVLFSDKIYIYPIEIVMYGMHPAAAQIIFVEPSKMIYYM